MAYTCTFFSFTQQQPQPGLLGLKIVKPLWPFLIAGSITTYLVAKAQDSGIRCTSPSSMPPSPSLLTLPSSLPRLAPEWRTDPRNPYAAQLAKESLH